MLARVDRTNVAPDPELHYLLGEALWTLGRDREARAVHAHARAELGTATERLPRLWLARIEGRLGERDAADRIYEALLAQNPADGEAALAQVEMLAAAGDWSRAADLTRRFLALAPDHRRGEELLAWIEEARGNATSELALRKKLAAGGAFDAVSAYGRALERTGDWAGALAAYRRAAGAPGGATDPNLRRALERLERRLSPEVAAQVIARSDPGASSIGAATGMAVPFGSAHHLAISAWNELASASGRESYAAGASVGVSLRRGVTGVIAGARLGMLDVTTPPGSATSEAARVVPGAFASAATTLMRGRLQITGDAAVGEVWRDAARSVLEGGTSDSTSAHVFGIGFEGRVVIDSGVQLRRLQLVDAMDSAPESRQAMVWTGADVTLWRNFGSEAVGESLDDELLRPTYLADSAVLSYRHYELWGDTDAAFGARMSLADRATIDELSIAARKALAHGRVAVEVRAGAGRDWVRDLFLSRASASLWLAPSARSRFTLSVELARESTEAIAGERRTGWMGYHVDL